MKAIVVGIGNPNFKDDGVGLNIVEKLNGLVDTVSLLNISFQIIDSILGYDKAVIVDGVKSGAEPGSILEFNTDYWGDIYASGTHNLSIFEILRIGYSLFSDEMPKEIKIIGVEVEDVETLSRQLSPSVEAAIPDVISKIKEYLGIKEF
ncbi:hydrogenase maturation protease [Thermodesulfovibrio sp. TK110]